MTTLLVANSGGHVAQLMALSAAFPDLGEHVWVSNKTSQTQSLLADRTVYWARYSAPRDIRSAMGHMALARRVLHEQDVDRIVSTGSSLAPPFIAVGRAARIECVYIESATRVAGPSLSGRLVGRLPGVRLYSQARSWVEGSRWCYGGTVWDRWEAVARPDGPRVRPRVLVTTGTARDYPFPEMIDACLRILDPTWEIVWQVGDHPHPELPGRVASSLSYSEMAELTANADLVVSHAGVGSTILALEAGLRPLLFARASARGEHIDDHQLELGAALSERGLAEVIEQPASATRERAERAMATRVVERDPGRLPWRF